MIVEGVAILAAAIMVVFSANPVMPMFFEKTADVEGSAPDVWCCPVASASLSHGESTDTISVLKVPSFIGGMKKGRSTAILSSGENCFFEESRCFSLDISFLTCSMNFPKKSIQRRAP